MPNHVTNKLKITGNKLDKELCIKNIKMYGEKNDDVLNHIDFNLIIPIPLTVYQHGGISAHEERIYGKNNWYDWCVKNWDTKWNAYDTCMINQSTIQFLTAWAAPIKVIKKLSQIFPKLTFSMKSVDEGRPDEVISVVFKNGRKV